MSPGDDEGRPCQDGPLVATGPDVDSRSLHQAGDSSRQAEPWERALTGFETSLVAAGARPGTIELRLRYLRSLAARHPGVSPWSLTLDDLTAFIARPSWAPETRRCALSALRALYGWGHRSGRRSDDPSRLLPPVRVPTSRPRPAPEDVLARALAAATPRQRLMLMLAAYAGLRRAEIASLHRDDVLADELRVTGKGGKVRAVPTHPALAAELAPHLQDAHAREDGWLFPGHRDGHLDPDSVGHTVSTLLPGKWTTHTLRHRFATAAYTSTKDLRAVQTLLGHASSQTTERYTAVSPESLRAAVTAAGPLVAAVQGVGSSDNAGQPS